MTNEKCIEIKKMIQAGIYGKQTFKTGDLLKVTVEDNGTKNVYIGRFLYFKVKNKFFGNGIGIMRKSTKTYLMFRHQTVCSEGLFTIDEEMITKIKIIKEK